ncbi:MAG: CDP-alcohol phosphatidyltransferase family protein [Acidobacteria bacterium]|nr:CDP-alcohol phosphatidyltransferase family protein [Acidobacteriota bacterium]
MSQVLTLANLLTILRMALVPIFVSAVYYGRMQLALALWVLAGLSDVLDGLLARTLNQRTTLGVVLDPIADKIMLVTAFMVLTSRGLSFEPIPFWLTATAISRDFFILMGSLLIFITTGFRNFQPSLLGKLNTLVQVVVITVFLARQLRPEFAVLLMPLYLSALVLAVSSGMHYIFHASHLLNQNREGGDSK